MVLMETKICTKCKGDPQPIENFRFVSKAKGGRRRSWCRKCEREIQKEYETRTRHKKREYQREYEHSEIGKAARQRSVVKLRDSGWRYEHDRKKHTLKKYGLTEFEYRKLVQRQGGKCAICYVEPAPYNGHKRGFHVDHDHETGYVRGLLCGNCNSALGHLKDNIESLASAIQYLVRSKAIQETKRESETG